ncbi:cystathionine gamma-lyase [Alteromonas sp. ASW11-36]|uniref:Cystathionine gamma-lyase n=1 Tax=Alteromonas arenosi TaxID=3055817 RepID=A0ABT7SYJ8_9ALTE|nr:cystathionine gamma-lyase [Alteromonas sp. ASW11-36]MDM7861265.1 cystathionine gamma-lyase [Alteromonas sp. ASW11-36]
MKKKMQRGTQVVHAGLPKASQGMPFNQGPVFASTFHLSGDCDSADYQYARFNNPTWQALEDGLAELEGGETVIFPSGMAAAAAIMTSVLTTGDKVVLPGDGYFATRAYAHEFLEPNGIAIELVATCDLLEADYSGVTLVLIESPSNPMLDVVDIAQLAKRIHAAGGLLAIDNTTATVLGQQPLALGADFSMSADTKAVNGHSDVVFGHVSGVDPQRIERVRLWRKLAGNIPGPMETWLVHRGLATLDMRLERMTQNAQRVAEFLSANKNVASVRYPGLSSDPSHEVAQQQMSHMGFIVSFDLGTQKAADMFLHKATAIFEATSFGGVHTMAERRARWGTDNVSPGLIRLSVGCEKCDDIIAELTACLSGE